MIDVAKKFFVLNEVILQGGEEAVSVSRNKFVRYANRKLFFSYYFLRITFFQFQIQSHRNKYEKVHKERRMTKRTKMRKVMSKVNFGKVVQFNENHC